MRKNECNEYYGHDFSTNCKMQKSYILQSIFQDKNAMKQHQKLNSHAQDGQHLQIIYWTFIFWFLLLNSLFYPNWKWKFFVLQVLTSFFELTNKFQTSFPPPFCLTYFSLVLPFIIHVMMWLHMLFLLWFC